MMKIIIIEDEIAAARRLEKMLKDIDSNIELLANPDSIKSSIDLFNQQPDYDMVFMDIHLADGLSFEIFNHVTILKPLIFVTAYDEYAIKAFKVNALDYVLKPVKKLELEQAYQKVTQSHFSSDFDYKKLAEAVRDSDYKRRFLVRI